MYVHFCNQSRITGQSGISHLTPDYIKETITEYVGSKRKRQVLGGRLLWWIVYSYPYRFTTSITSSSF